MRSRPGRRDAGFQPGGGGVAINYYEHHLGDYAEATAHLSFLEDAAYSRLIRKYYATERPIPADLKTVQRLVGARLKEEREAVESVLKEFFELQEDGWHNTRCDVEIAKYVGKEPDREEKRQHELDRKKRHREKRAHLFTVLKGAGIDPDWNTTTAELERLGRQYDASPETPSTWPETSPGTSKGTARDAPSTATQSPVPTSQSPVPSPHASPDARARGQPIPDTALHEAGIRAAYPPFPGRQDWLTPLHHCRQLVERCEASWDSLIDAAQRYAAYVAAGGVSEPKYILTPAKFFNAPDKPWKQPWTEPATKADTRLASNLTAAEEFMRRTEPQA